MAVLGSQRFQAAMASMDVEQQWAVRVIFSAERALRHAYPSHPSTEEPVERAYLDACRKIR